jgi:hypothetical protein
MLSDIEFEQIEKNRGKYFGDQEYDTLVEICKHYFPMRVKVNVKNRQIIICDQIGLRLNLSGNETKVYFDSFVYTNEKEKSLDSFLYYNASFSFRLFSIRAIEAYLVIKAQENDFIKKYQG